jgi:hypothetical protein
MTRVLVLVVLASILGQLEAAPVPKGGPKLWKFPTQVGTKWVYTESGDRDAEVSESILKVEETPGGPRLISVRYESGWVKNGVNWGVLDVATLWIDDTGLFDVTWQKNHYEPTFCLLKFRCAAGDTWEWKSPEPTSRAASRVGAEEKLKVPAGEFDCVRIETKMYKGEVLAWARTDWYAAGVGLVKSTGYPNEKRPRAEAVRTGKGLKRPVRRRYGGEGHSGVTTASRRPVFNPEAGNLLVVTQVPVDESRGVCQHDGRDTKVHRADLDLRCL